MGKSELNHTTENTFDAPQILVESSMFNSAIN